MDGDGTPTTDIDVRVAQLQHALTSRIVVEQAKGDARRALLADA